MSTDWIEVHDHGSVYMARVFLLDNDESYMITVRDGQNRFFKVDANLLKYGELRFFENVMKNAKELLFEKVIKMGFAKDVGKIR